MREVVTATLIMGQLYFSMLCITLMINNTRVRRTFPFSYACCAVLPFVQSFH